MHEGWSQTEANAGMHHFTLGGCLAMIFATILFCVLALNLLNKKKRASAPSFRCPRPTGGSEQYDVFLSFRGSDTRTTFADHLYHGLEKAGTVPIGVFRDKDSIPIGEKFDSKILDAITQSKISIPIISENYASSKWCLLELIHMMKLKSESHKVFPIFYKVKPSDVRNLDGKFGEAFYLSKKRFDKKDIEEAKQALKEVSFLQAWESEKIADGYEGDLVELVVKTVRTELWKDFQQIIPEELVGLHGPLGEIMEWIDGPTDNARMIGIFGMGGIGKTTFAKVLYYQLINRFEGASFLLNVREDTQRHGITYLQKKLISDILLSQIPVSTVDEGINMIQNRFKGKNVLILLDDIDHRDQLDALARKHSWFMRGSLIIVTTRYEAILDQSKFEVGYKYKMKELDEVDSLLLFNKHAFPEDHSSEGFEGISRDIVSTTGGLPLAIMVIGASLYKKSELNIWKDILNQLKEQPNEDVQMILKISYDALKKGQREIFLDIACFFIGEESNYAMYMWEDSKFYPSEGIEELKLRCLINIEDNGTLMMHDQLRDMGRSIVCQEPLESRSRLWVPEEASRVVRGKKGTEKIGAIFLDHFWEDQADAFMSYYMGVVKSHHHAQSTITPAQTYTNEHFQSLQSLRLLILNGVAFSGDFTNLLSELRWLSIKCDPSFPATNLCLPKLVVLVLRYSLITEHSEHWRGRSLIMAAKQLKVLRLDSCPRLWCIPDLSGLTKLEILILKDCDRLMQIHPSIGEVESLVHMEVSLCKNVRELPKEVGKLKELKQLILYRVGITKIPTSIGSLRKLEKLSVGDSPLRKIPSSIGNLSSLEHLDLQLCKSLREIPNSIGNLSSLQHLNLKHCESLWEIPISIGDLKNCNILT